MVLIIVILGISDNINYPGPLILENYMNYMEKVKLVTTLNT